MTIRDGQGVIGLTFCPGKKHHGMYSGSWDRDIFLDLEAIQKFDAKALVTLMEGEELAHVKVPAATLASQSRRYGLEWHHLPVRDLEAPDDRFEDFWTYSGLKLRTILARGEKVVLHCRGGLGRTGTVAARLLVEFGDPPELAIRKVREARPGSIETHTQEAYVENCRPVAFARVVRSQEQRALACLLGGAIGDAFGYEVEFKRTAEIRELFGERGIKEPVFHAGKLRVSDDTQMTLFTLEGLLRHLERDDTEAASSIDSIRNAYLDWLDTQSGGTISASRRPLGWLAQQSEMRVPRHPGSTCLSALHAGGNGTISKPENNSKGCGGAMRVAPVGLVGPNGDAQAAFRLAAETAALTHGHPSGYLSAGVVASIVRLLMDGTRLNNRPSPHQGLTAIGRSCELLGAYRGHEETLAAVKKSVRLASTGSPDHVAVIVISLI